MMVTVGRMSPGICPTPLPEVSLVSEATGGSEDVVTCVVEDGDVVGESGAGPHGRRAKCWWCLFGYLHPRLGPLGQGKVVKERCNREHSAVRPRAVSDLAIWPSCG